MDFFPTYINGAAINRVTLTDEKNNNFVYSRNKTNTVHGISSDTM